MYINRQKAMTTKNNITKHTALISREEHIQEMEKLYIQEIETINSKIAMLKERKNELPENVPFVIHQQTKQVMGKLRPIDQWFSLHCSNIRDNIPIAIEIENGDRGEYGMTNIPWTKEAAKIAKGPLVLKFIESRNEYQYYDNGQYLEGANGSTPEEAKERFQLFYTTLEVVE